MLAGETCRTAAHDVRLDPPSLAPPPLRSQQLRRSRPPPNGLLAEEHAAPLTARLAEVEAKLVSTQAPPTTT